MFGYVVVNKPELKIKEFNTYQSYYCGLCRALKKGKGVWGQLSLSYDMTFLALLLSALYEPEESETLCRCGAHPTKQHRVKKNEMLDYVADMNLLLTWYKCQDDVLDEGSAVKAIYGKLLSSGVKQRLEQYPRQGEAMQEEMKRLRLLEQQESADLDALSGCFGRLLSQVFAIREDEWASALRKMGFYMGRFVYILDAYDDLERDAKRGCFNPLSAHREEEGFSQWVEQLLRMAMTEFAGEFEKLPILQNVEILRNIIYSGVWSRFYEIQSRRTKAAEGKKDRREDDHEKSL
jgi:hypothetical protein